MEDFAVVPDELQRSDGVLAAAVAAARSAVADLHAVADDTVSGWHGGAAIAFRIAWEDWSAGVRLLLEALDEMAAAVGAAGVGYAQTDDAVRTTLARAAS